MQDPHVPTQKNNPLFRALNVLAPLAALCGTLSFIAVAVFGFGKSGSPMGDFNWYYAGGLCFLRGSSMYDVGCFGPLIAEFSDVRALAGVPYPPHFAPFAAALATPSLFWSSLFFRVANISVAFAMAFVIVDTERRISRPEGSDVPLQHLWAIALVFGSSGVWGAVWLGQISFFIALLVWLAFRSIEAGNTLVAGVFLAIISVKPQMSVLLFVWILLHGRFKVLAVAAFFAGLLSLYAFAKMGVLPAIQGWAAGLAAYQSYPENVLGNGTIMGLPSFLALYGLTIPLPLATAIGAFVLLFLRIYSKAPPFSPIALSTILLVQMTVFSRPIDTVLIAPAFAVFWPSGRSHPRHLLLFLLTAAVICFPQQIAVALLPFPEVAHFRTLPIAVLAIVFIRQMLIGKTRFELRTADEAFISASVAGRR